MMMRKEDQRKQEREMQKLRDEDEFMAQILEQKKQLLLEAINSLGLDHQDLPKGTGLNTLNYGQ